jgi:hypothetical protein
LSGSRSASQQGWQAADAVHRRPRQERAGARRRHRARPARVDVGPHRCRARAAGGFRRERRAWRPHGHAAGGFGPPLERADRGGGTFDCPTAA